VRIAELGRVGDDGHVGKQCQGGAQAHGVTVDGGNDRLLHLQHALEQPVRGLGDVQRIVPALLGAEARRHALDVATGRKHLAGAGEDDDVDLAVVAQVAPHLLELGVHLGVHGVAVVGLVERQRGDALAALDVEVLVAAVVGAHGRTFRRGIVRGRVDPIDTIPFSSYILCL
jgi:hypothetical protein